MEQKLAYDIEILYEIKVVKYNFDEPYLSYKKVVKNRPNKIDIIQAIRECDKLHPDEIYYGTKTFVTKFWQMKND